MTLNGAIMGIIVGAITVIVWKNTMASTGLYEIIPGFILSFASIVVVSLLEKAPSQEIVQRFEQADELYKKEMAELQNELPAQSENAR